MNEKCPKCGAERSPGETECLQCGIVFDKYEASLNTQNQWQEPPTQQLATPGPAFSMPKNSSYAIWSLVLGILSPFCCGLFTGIPAVILGHLGRSEVRKSEGRVTGDGMALAGLILGYVSIVLYILLVAFGMIGAILEEFA